MSAKTSIEWCDATWPVVVGCKEISPGCANCWAARLAATRLKQQPKYRGLAVIGANGHTHFNGDVRLWEPHLDWPLKWREPRRIFAASSSDLFHDALSPKHIAAVYGVMAASQQHTFQVLTKRPENARAWYRWLAEQSRDDDTTWTTLLRETCAMLGSDRLRDRIVEDGIARDGVPKREPWPLPNVHVGVSVEDRKHGLPRIDVLREIPATVRWLSIEPLLEDLGTIDLRGIDWVVVGGESTQDRSARPMHPAWVRSIRDQCIAAGVKFHFKQWGTWAPYVDPDRYTHDAPEDESHSHVWMAADGAHGACWIYDGDGSWTNWTGEPPKSTDGERVRNDVVVFSPMGKKHSGRLLDGRTWDEFPEVRP
ncbi:MAG TPA: phage Gp37/Gp68 family protein [Kofleriaceae bacterium]|nr:phage Gp37/Gp68 family protein [Kofleriaceae bacterium]